MLPSLSLSQRERERWSVGEVFLTSMACSARVCSISALTVHQLDSFDGLTCVYVLKILASGRQVIAEYKLSTDALVAKQKRSAETEYRRARKEASKSANKIIKERQGVLGEMFKEQLATFKDQGQKGER